jgi:hypothetical protein
LLVVSIAGGKYWSLLLSGRVRACVHHQKPHHHTNPRALTPPLLSSQNSPGHRRSGENKFSTASIRNDCRSGDIGTPPDYLQTGSARISRHNRRYISAFRGSLPHILHRVCLGFFGHCATCS